jgi:hypothetical protein
MDSPIITISKTHESYCLHQANESDMFKKLNICPYQLYDGRQIYFT